MATIYKQGMTDPYVGEIQKRLTSMGYNPGPIDNIYGPKTAAAVKQFQADRGIASDAIWGPQTEGAYSSYITSTTPATPMIPTSDTTTGQPAKTERLEFAYSPETLDYLSKLQTSYEKPFDYEDVLNSSLYHAQKEQYEQMGQSAFSNTIGQLAAMTGGRPSTAAVGTAASAANQYQQAFQANVLPQITEQAYGMSQDQKRNQLNLLNVLMSKDVSEFDRKMAIEEFEWGRSEDNPAYKAQILANKITAFQVEHQEEEWNLQVKEWKARISQAETIAKYAPLQAQAALDAIYQDMKIAEAGFDKAQKEEEKDKPLTASQRTGYNNYIDLYKNDPQSGLAFLSDPYNEEVVRQQLGDNGYEQLLNELDDMVKNPPEADEITFDKGTKEYKSTISTVLTEADSASTTPEGRISYVKGIRGEIVNLIGTDGYNEILSILEADLPKEDSLATQIIEEAKK